ncbi:MAG TPA: ComF family protein [Gammaproteobacteria bacterium]|nr:ComF family protein [Gammaproteobacteria bacterium]
MGPAGCQPGGSVEVDKWWRRLSVLLCPPTCVLCGAGAERRDLCAGCERDLPRPDRACPRCALPLPGTGESHCGRCQQRPPPFARALCAFDYAFPVDRLLQALKFRGALVNGRLLGELLAEHVARFSPVLPAIIVPMPLHRSRLGERGFNQAFEIARPLARRFGRPLETRRVTRVRATLEQTGLDARARRANLRGAFSALPGGWPAHVAVVDDVMTTGSTACELTRSLRRAGVRRVEVWCVARAA